jgi:methionyl-tRNA formyltransferase
MAAAVTEKTRVLDVAVLSCSPIGVEVAARLADMKEVGRVMLVTAPYTRRRRSVLKKLRLLLRHEGLPGLARVLRRRLAAVGRRRATIDAIDVEATRLPANVRHLHVTDLHGDECPAALREFGPTLGVVVGTYILRPSVFEIPTLGMINLHCGKVPQYRGAAPAFWELYEGDREVGITIHWVEATLDAGDIVCQETFPLDCAPAEDPLRYIERYYREVLTPNGIRLLLDAVARIAEGGRLGSPQDSAHATTYPIPDYRSVRELRKRVRDRRRLSGQL